MSLKNYELDPAWYTTPSVAWDAALKVTGAVLELLYDPDMLLMLEKGTRGGISMITNRCGKANNPYMGEDHDASKPSKYIPCLDANNLYGWAMYKPLPVGNFNWMTEFNNWKNIPCIPILNTFEYPKELHALHNDYPSAPERFMINKEEKLIPNLNNKKKYVIHHEDLKLYESLGLKITKIHRGIGFKKEPWLKKYIELNTKLRMEAKNDFEKDFFQGNEQLCLRKNVGEYSK